ncbi:F510_1955 family glycosylhydrolase [Streptomyces sp. TRM64462]|uniref:F510_1955 family glycosylhydrolase n=1 Tax=Streptomyces sp. TRM64462 TaxID=2741726 RepID=UPI001586BC09|nr:exo-alpha-sialidase [Streptomyces sp. TRM64462]
MNIRTRTTATAAALLALALPLAGCASPDSGSGGTVTTATGDVIRVSHIHGLGVDPADGRVHVATHEGILTPNPDGTARRVGDSHDDYMGFTVVGPRTFVASGHPGHGNDDEPGNRGLIESTDAGVTWKVRSLSGGADFHALDYAHGTVYGYDSTGGRLRVSEDRENWDDRAELRALDIAVSPEDPDTVLATTGKGIARSTDGGRTFGPGAEPVMAYVSWPAADALFGLDPQGGLHRSADGGRTWRKVSTVPGSGPQALTAVTAGHILAATESGVYESKDGGRTFERILATTPGAH